MFISIIIFIIIFIIIIIINIIIIIIILRLSPFGGMTDEGQLAPNEDV